MGHIHAAAMAEYAKDAAETDMPWERWEVSMTESGDEYRNLLGHPDWAVTRKYRRKPKTILINGHEVPEPHRKPLEIDRNLRGKPRGSARGSSEQAGTACGATSVASGQLACEVQQGQPHQPLPTAMLSGE